MGRRSINTTKSGKYMNPTDQARKEARKRELKKNKKQRMLVRTAVLKGKDPHQILADLERLDKMEYNVNAPPPLNEKVLRDKRRKSKETWDRLCRLYVSVLTLYHTNYNTKLHFLFSQIKEDHDKFLELKRLEAEYDTKRNQLIKFYEAVKSTQDVALDDIPLPSLPVEAVPSSTKVTLESSEPISILKKPNTLSKDLNKEPPGLPPGPPPSLRDLDVDLSDEEEEKFKKVRFNEEKESDLSEFLKEIENVEKTVGKREPSSLPKTSQSVGNMTLSTSTPAFSSQIQPTPPPSLLMLRLPINNLSSVPIPKPGLAANTNLARPGLMLPPPPPPQSHLRPLGIPQNRINLNQNNPRVNSLGPRPGSRKEDKKTSHLVSDRATIEAKPQLRNLSADATRFMPVSLRVKRSEKPTKKAPRNEGNWYFYFTMSKLC